MQYAWCMAYGVWRMSSKINKSAHAPRTCWHPRCRGRPRCCIWDNSTPWLPVTRSLPARTKHTSRQTTARQTTAVRQPPSDNRPSDNRPSDATARDSSCACFCLALVQQLPPPPPACNQAPTPTSDGDVCPTLVPHSSGQSPAAQQCSTRSTCRLAASTRRHAQPRGQQAHVLASALARFHWQGSGRAGREGSGSGRERNSRAGAAADIMA